MKKLLGILVLGLLTACGGMYTGKDSERRGEIYFGIDKSTFCQNNLNYICWGARKTVGNPKLYYLENDYEVISSIDYRFYVFKDATFKIDSAAPNTYGNGKLISIHDSMREAMKSIENDIAGIRSPEQIAEDKKIKKQQEKKQRAEAIASGDITFTINDKKEQCEAIGFVPQTEKFADCVLRLVELDVKSQQANQIALAESQGNQQIADELRAQRNQQSGAYLMDLGQKLLNPPTKRTTRCTVTGTGSFKTVSCR